MLGYFGYFGCVMGNGIKHCCRRKRIRREENRQQRQLEKRRRRERQEEERAQTRTAKIQHRPVTIPQPAHLAPSSSVNFNGSRRPTHGSSARIAGSDSLHNTSANNVSSTPSRIDAWNVDVERGRAPDSVSVQSYASSQGRARLQKPNRGHSADASSQGSRSLMSHHSEDRQMGSTGSSSILFGGRISSDQRSTSAQGLLSEHL